mgnify:CR=1 FL=1
MFLEFTKMHGLGNDFMVIDLISQRAYLDALTIQRLADRLRSLNRRMAGVRTKLDARWRC